MAIKLIHCADLHLDAVLSNTFRANDHENLSTSEIQTIRDAPLLALDKIGTYAIDNTVDAIVIAGDIFDKKENTTINLRARSRFVNFLNRLNENNIEVFISLGNHDPVSSANEISAAWPDNTHLFNPDVPHTFEITIRNQKVAFHGVSYATTDESRNLASMFPSKIQDAFNIGILHTNVGGDSNHSNYAPSSVDTLSSFNYDYFALGHIHKRTVLNEFPLVAYSGNSQGLSSKPSEQTPKGCLVVEIDQPNSSPTYRFIETDVVRYTSHDFSIQDVETPEDLVSAVLNRLTTENAQDCLYLSKIEIQTSGYEHSHDPEYLRQAINDTRRNTIVTSLKIRSGSENWENLTELDPYFEHLDSQIPSEIAIDFQEIYGSKADTIQTLLSQNQIFSLEKQEIVDHFIQTHSYMRQKEKK